MNIIRHLSQCTIQPGKDPTEFRLQGLIAWDSSAQFSKGDFVTTTRVKMIDFERGIAVTKSGNTYTWQVSQ